MQKQLVLLASAFTYRAQAFEAAARKLGIPVVRGEDVPPPMLDKANVRLPIDYRDVPRSAALIEAYAQEHPVGAIVGLDDSGTLIAAAACERLGLPHNAPEAALAARDKHIMRRKFAQAGVPSPRFRHFTFSDDPEIIADEVSYPCVIKPTVLSGSRGVMRVDHPLEFLHRWLQLKRIVENEGCDEFLVEDYVPGVEVALEGLLHDGALHPLALFDKPDPLDGPYFEETIYVTPSRLPAGVQEEIVRTAQQAAAALGLRQGPVHAELRVHQGQPVMIEMAARSIGGKCSKALRFEAGASLEELILRQAFGLPPAESGLPAASGVMMIPIPESGILAGVEGLEAAMNVPLIEEIEITAPLHRPILALPEGNSYLGFIFARGEAPEAVENALRKAHARLEIEILPQLALHL